MRRGEAVEERSERREEEGRGRERGCIGRDERTRQIKFEVFA
jgi:hypothetical protein